MLLSKAIGFRIIAILFTSLFTGLQTSLILNIGLFLLYYFYDLIWYRYLVSCFPIKKQVVRMGLSPAQFLASGQRASGEPGNGG